MAIDRMLKDQHGQVMTELAELNKITTGLAYHLASLSGLATAVDAAAPQLSDQAIAFLRQCNASNASKAIEVISSGGHDYIFADAAGGLDINEERFLDDDIQTLVGLGLLILKFNSRGDNVITITRAGAALGQQPAPAG